MKEKSPADLESELNKLREKNRILNQKIEGTHPPFSIDTLEQLVNVFFEKITAGIILFDTEGKIQKVNSYLTEMLNYSEEEIKKIGLKKITHPDEYETSLKKFQDVLNGNLSNYSLEKRYLRKDGQIVYAKANISAIYNAHRSLQHIVGIIENRTSKIETEKKLAKEQRLLNALMRSIPDSIYFKDLESKVIKANDAKAKKFGYKNPDDMIGTTDFDIFSKEHAQQAYNDEQEIIKTGKPIIGVEEKETWPDGKITWASTSKLPLYDENGKVIGTFGMTRDITKRKEMDKALKESEERYRKLFQTSADGMFLMTDVVIECNDAACKIFNCEKDQIINRSPMELSPEYQEDGRKSSDLFNEKIKLVLQEETQNFYWRYNTAEGKIIDAEVTLNPIVIEGRKLIQSIFRDITDRSRYEKVREALFEISEAAYNVDDMESLYKQIHQAIKRLMPAKNFYIALYDEKTELLSFPYFVDEIDPPQKPKKLGKGLTEYVLRTGEEILVDAAKDLELRKSGEVELIGEPQAIWLGVPLKIRGKAVGVIVVQDYKDPKAYGEEELLILTFVSDQVVQAIERRKNAEDIKKYAEELRQLNATKDKFFSIIAHDLKNPFITILGFSDLLISDYSELSDEEKIYYIQEMKKSADKSHNLLHNLLQWSRSQTGRIEYNPQKLSLNEIVGVNTNLLEASSQKKKINIVNDVPSETFVYADEDMLNTILRNLMTNALKFTNRGGEIKISSSDLNEFVEVTVADNGIGMEEDVRKNLFQLDNTYTSVGTQNESGTGLGLVLCKEFIEKNGGAIKVESVLGKGTKFIFTLLKNEQK